MKTRESEMRIGIFGQSQTEPESESGFIRVRGIRIRMVWGWKPFIRTRIIIRFEARSTPILKLPENETHVHVQRILLLFSDQFVLAIS